MIAEVYPQQEVPLEVKVEPLKQESSAIERLVTELVIATPEDHDRACAWEKEIAEKERRAVELTQPTVDALNKAVKEARELRDNLVTPFQRAKQALKAKIGAWRDERRSLAAQAAATAQAAIQRQAEDMALAHAAVLAESGNAAAADLVLLQPVVPVVVPIAPPVANNGVVTRESWSAEVTDLSALIAWVGQDIPNRSRYLTACGPELNREAKRLKSGFGIPGVRPVRKFC